MRRPAPRMHREGSTAKCRLPIKAAFVTLVMISIGPLGPGTARARQGRAVRRSVQKLSEPVEEILWWFPEDTQTVIVARGPFKLKAPEPEARNGIEVALQSLPMT